MGGRREREGSPESRAGLPIGDEADLGEISRLLRSDEYLTEEKLVRALDIAFRVLQEDKPGSRPIAAPPKPPDLRRR